MEENRILSQLLGIAPLEVKRAEFTEKNELYLNVEPTIEVAACPDCGKISMQEHDRGDEQKVRDLTMAERRCWLLYRPRRFRCEVCQKTFVERVEWRRSGMSYTTRFGLSATRREEIQTKVQVNNIG